MSSQELEWSLTISLFSRNHRLRFTFYNFFRCRCFCNLLLCIFGVFIYLEGFYHLIDKSDSKMNYWHLYLQVFLVYLPIRVSLHSSAILDIFLILNRMALLYNKKKSRFFTLSKKVKAIKTIKTSLFQYSPLRQANLLICFSLSIVMIAPFYFAFK